MHAGLKSKLVALAMMGIAVGLAACAKYPVVSDYRSSSPSAEARPAAR